MLPWAWLPPMVIMQDNIEQEMNHALALNINASEKLPIIVYLRTDTPSSVIVIKINQAIRDGAGSKYCVNLLASCYTNQENNRSKSFQKRFPNRTTPDIYNALGITDLDKYI
jgi:NRPS condensation-like uncharacterized protein